MTATMALLGNANWGLPQWLDRVLTALAIEGADEGVPNAKDARVAA